MVGALEIEKNPSQRHLWEWETKHTCAEISGGTGLVAKPLFNLKAFHLKCLKTCTPKTQLTERTRARTGVRSAAWFFKSLSFCTIEKICLSR